MQHGDLSGLCGVVLVSFKDMDLLGFKVEREAWLYYELSDGTRMRYEIVVNQVAKSRTQRNPAGEPMYQIKTQQLFGLLSFDEALRGPPSSGNITKKRLSISLDQQVTFSLQPNQEVWNVYRFDDGTTLEISPVLNSVVRTKLRGSVGEPFYLINSGYSHKLKVPSSLIMKH